MKTAEHTLDYARRVADIVGLLTGGFTPDAVNVVMAHATLLGGRRGGGERDVQTTLDYELSAGMFPATRATTSRSGTCTASRRYPGPAPSFTQGPRWPSTSAKRPTSQSC